MLYNFIIGQFGTSPKLCTLTEHAELTGRRRKNDMVPITSEEIRSPYYRHFVRRMKEPDRSFYEAARDWTDASMALLPEELNLLFEDSGVKMENGISRLADGCAAIALTMDMPGTTPEMFHWWFAWHSLEPMRFKIWNREEHYDCVQLSPAKTRGSALTMAERYQNTICEFEEDLGFGPEHIRVHYRRPEDFGFSPEKLRDFGGAIVCTGDTRSPVTVVHFLTPTDRGSLLRTRVWLGCGIEKGRPKRLLPPGALIPIEPARAHFCHLARDFAHLAEVLPELYEQFGKDF